MRKSPRLSYFDYSRNGAYFITICTQDRKHLFGTVGADSISARIVEKTFLETIQKYPAVNCPKYVVMPNHFHAIITIIRGETDYIKIWEYIENNPRTWENDCFYDENPSNNEK
jgi:REP element-mobilizing transposase RayT